MNRVRTPPVADALLQNGSECGTDRPFFCCSYSTFFPGLELFFANVAKAQAYRHHVNDRLQITWILAGHAEVACLHGTYQLGPGDGILTAPEQLLAGRACSREGIRFASLQIPADLVSHLALRGSSGIMDPHLVLLSHGAAINYAAMSSSLAYARSSGDELDAVARSIGGFIQSAQRSATRKAKDAERNGVIGQIRARLDSSLGEKADPYSVACDAGLNRRYMITIFKAATGISPHQYLISHRLEFARRLLNTGMSPGFAAAESGFADQSHLTRSFKRTFGVTPGVYQAQRMPLTPA